MIPALRIKTIKQHRTDFFLVLSIIWCICLTWLSADHAFFWDTIQLGSKHAHHYYEHNFSSLLLPQTIDSGHPPYFGMYLAACWKLFGRSLPVSHWAMFPFLLLLVWQWFRLGKRLVGKNWLPFFVLFLLIDPVVASQASLVSPDLVLAACFLLLLNSIYAGESNYQVIAVMALGMISTRGMMVAFLVFIWQYVFLVKRIPEQSKLSQLIDTVRPYLPGGILAAGYLVYHYLATGWIGYHAESEWAPSFRLVDFRQLLKNLIVLVWRLLDFGRVFVAAGLLAFMLVLMRQGRWKKGKVNPQLVRMLALLVILSVGLGISFLAYSGLQQHRYLLPVYLIMTLLLFLLIAELSSTSWTRTIKSAVLGAIAIGLLTGNLWIYPDRISQGWDATLAHWPFYSLRQEMHNFVRKNDIPLAEVGTAFPEIGPLKFKDLNKLSAGYKEKDLRADNYILYSNIMNDFSDVELWRLEEEWEIVQQIRRRGVKMILYRRAE